MTKVLECHLDTLAPPAWNKKSVMEILLQHSTEQTGLYNIAVQGISGYSLPERKRGLIATSLVVTAQLCGNKVSSLRLNIKMKYYFKLRCSYFMQGHDIIQQMIYRFLLSSQGENPPPVAINQIW